ncbi:MAG: FAD:protein FMN transferase [Bacilli bacterium]|jgi:thiamine biosynthesis lipoprotein ApbE|nr:FAD:protein FMN transferase [Bacilli bacterium]
MKKQAMLGFLSVALGLSLSGCLWGDQEAVQNYTASYLSSDSGLYRPVSTDGRSLLLPPFDTAIGGNLYYHIGDYSDTQLDDIKSTFENTLAKYHALTDRHYDYQVYDSATAKTDTTKSYLPNLKTLNDSYGTGKAVTVDDFLYQLLKKSYDFSLKSQGKFNLFLGTISDIYEAKLDSLSSSDTALDKALSLANNLTFASDLDATSLQQATVCVPKTVDEMTDLLTFDDATKSVTFHAFSKSGCESAKVSVSLGGDAKGYAIEALGELYQKTYPSISLLINAGSSSVKAVGQRPDKLDWTLRYANPLYEESLDPTKGSLNPQEVALKHSGAFALSTSGYYQQSFYVWDQTGNTYLRREHIVDSETGYSQNFFDQVSVLMDDSGLADCYTTALMNTASVSEAQSLFASLNTIYGVTPSLILCHKITKGDTSGAVYAYQPSQLTNLSSQGYPQSTVSRSSSTSDTSAYAGDYSDLSASEVIGTLSPANRDVMQELYQFSADLYPSAYLITDTSVVTYPNAVKSVIQELT